VARRSSLFAPSSSRFALVERYQKLAASVWSKPMSESKPAGTRASSTVCSAYNVPAELCSYVTDAFGRQHILAPYVRTVNFS
jgi:hypothetical protein